MLMKGTDSLANITEADVDACIAEINFLTFSWNCVPKPIFMDIFRAFKPNRLAFFGGYFKCWFDSVSDPKTEELCEALWSHFQRK